MNSQYESALKQCEKVAEEELGVSKKVLSGIERMVTSLLTEIEGLGKYGDEIGKVDETAEKIDAIKERLNRYGNENIRSARHSLEKKAEHISKFTVTLFGRTMAGKSTLREAITRGDGKTIGKGSQRTTRDIKEYEWNHLRIVDTPGIGAYKGEADRDLAQSVVDESDTLLFLVNSNGIQETAVHNMKTVRNNNKPMIFVLNVLLNLEQDVNMRRFLRNPDKFLGNQAVRAVMSTALIILPKKNWVYPMLRLFRYTHRLPFWQLKTRYSQMAEELHKASKMDSLIEALTKEVLRFGTVRRLQTILDGTSSYLVAFEELLTGQSKALDDEALYREKKFKELFSRFTRYTDNVDKRIKREVEAVCNNLRDSVSSFLEDNLHEPDVSSRWNRHVSNTVSNRDMNSIIRKLDNEVGSLHDEFHSEMNLEYELNHEFRTSGPEQYNPWDIKRTLRWISTGASPIISLIGKANFWNPVGWIALGVSALTLGLSWLSKDKNKKLQKQRAKAAGQLREQVDEIEAHSAAQVKKWFDENIANKLIKKIKANRSLCADMHKMAKLLQKNAMVIKKSVEDQHRRLICKTMHLIDTQQFHEKDIEKLVRAPGIKTKFLWRRFLRRLVDSAISTSALDKQRNKFCKDIGTALGEYVMGVYPGTAEQNVARSLFPAEVAPEMVSIEQKNRVKVKVPQSEIGRAIGRNGHNVLLASRLLDCQISIQEAQKNEENRI